jgi:TadE-like protein
MPFLPFLAPPKSVEHRNSERGAAMLEMALTLSFLLLIVFGITDFGRAMYTKIILANAAREGARYASVSPPFLPMTSAITHIKALLPNQKDLKIETLSNDAPITVPPQSGYPITVKLTLPFTTVAPGLIPWLNNLTLRGEATMRYEN